MGLLPLLFVALIAATSALADTPACPNIDNPLFEPRFESVGVGIIPRYVVPTVAQDRAGFLWIATGDGLVRFDGYRFRPRRRARRRTRPRATWAGSAPCWPDAMAACGSAPSPMD